MRFLGTIIAMTAAIALRDARRALESDLGLYVKRYRASAQGALPPVLIAALIAAEDRRLFSHGGVDVIALLRVFWCGITRRAWTGASTIEQQLVRTITGNYEMTLSRKVREILLASLVHRTVPKDEIPCLYLSTAYFGWRMNGIEQACRRLGFRRDSMTARQAASIVARLKYPQPRVTSVQRAQQIGARTRYILAVLSTRFSWPESPDLEVKRDAPVLDI